MLSRVLAFCLMTSTGLAADHHERGHHRSHSAEHHATRDHGRDLVTEAATDSEGRDNTAAIILDDGGDE